MKLMSLEESGITFPEYPISIADDFTMKLLKSFKRQGAYPKFLKKFKDLETGEDFCEVEFYGPKERGGKIRNQWFYTARQDIELLEELLRVWKTL